MPAKRKSTTGARAKRKPRNSYKPKVGRPLAFNPKTALAICALVAQGRSFDAACEQLEINVSSAYRWMLVQPDFREDLYRARELRGDWAFGEQILKIADDGSNDWKTAANGRPVVDKELVLRSKLRIEARRFHMERLHRDVWGEKVQTNLTVDYARMSEDERLEKARELLGMIREISGPRPQPTPLVYEPEEGPDEEPSGIGS